MKRVVLPLRCGLKVMLCHSQVSGNLLLLTAALLKVEGKHNDSLERVQMKRHPGIGEELKKLAGTKDLPEKHDHQIFSPWGGMDLKF